MVKVTENKVNLRETVVRGMLEKKAQDIVVMDLRKVRGAVADYFVICTGNTETQVEAISESIEEEVYKSTSENPWRKEGKQNKEWILIDYVDVVAHVFKKEKRAFFALEDLWGDAEIINISTDNE